MLWMVTQATIAFAVVASNIHWQWTPNGYLAVGLGIALAYGVTVTVTAIRGALRSRRAGRAHRGQVRRGY